jgi:hypothetical protein
MKLLSGIIILVICAACQTQSIPTPAVTVQEVPFVQPSPTPVCQAVSGVSIAIVTSIEGRKLQVKGLIPGERPTVFYSAQNSLGAERIEAFDFAEGADSKGNFTYGLTDLTVLKGDTSTTWDVRVVHSRGVACAQVKVP